MRLAKKVLILAPIAVFLSIFFNCQIQNDTSALGFCSKALTSIGKVLATTLNTNDESTQEMFAQNNILFYDPCSDNSTSSGESVWQGSTFDVSDGELYGLIHMALAEQDNLDGMKFELSLFANKADADNRTDIANYIRNSSWFASRTRNAYSEDRGNITDEQITAADDVIRKGHRIIPPQIVEHDCIGDIEWLEIDGEKHYASNAGECLGQGLYDSSFYVSGKTIIHNHYGSTYVFYTFPVKGDMKSGDPFGYFENNPPTEASSSSSEATATYGSYADTTEWEDGWIKDGTFQGYTKEDAGQSSKPFVVNGGKANKITLHYTEGETSGLAAYGGHPEHAAHFSIDLKNKTVNQHFPVTGASGAAIDSDDVRGMIQIEIVGYGFERDNPDNPSSSTPCIISGKDHTNSEYCFSKFGDAEWEYLAKLLMAINKWGKDNGTDIPLTTSVPWTGDIEGDNYNALRVTDTNKFDNLTGIVAHMHVPSTSNHNDTGNIWPLVENAIKKLTCNSTGNSDSISGAKNADKQATEVGSFAFNDGNTTEMKDLLEKYGDLAYRTGQTYDVPWIAILVQARYEDGRNSPETWCGKNNAWGIACPPGTSAGNGKNYNNLGDGFNGYGETIHNGSHDQAIGIQDPSEYLEKLGPTWVQGDPGGSGYAAINEMKKTVKSLQDYINSDEGKKVVAEFGAAECGNQCTNPYTNENGDVTSAVQYIIDLANKNGSNYSSGGGHGGKDELDKFLNGASIDVDCTGFVNLVMYKAFGEATSIASASISGDSHYEFISNVSEAKPGDVGILNKPNATEDHGFIIVEVSGGKVTKIAETNRGRGEGSSGNNHNIGYSDENSWSVKQINSLSFQDSGSSAVGVYRWKGGNTK